MCCGNQLSIQEITIKVPLFVYGNKQTYVVIA